MDNILKQKFIPPLEVRWVGLIIQDMISIGEKIFTRRLS